MGVQPPDKGDLADEPRSRTPSEDDLYSDSVKTTTTTNSVFRFDHDFRNILPVIPAKGIFEDFLGANYWDAPNEKKYCGKCYEDVKKDLKKLAEVVEGFKNERDVARNETEALRKEVEELKKLVKNVDKGSVKINIADGKENVDVIVRNNVCEENCLNNNESPKVRNVGIVSLSISLPNANLDKSVTNATSEVNTKKTIADLRREFFARELGDEQQTFTTQNYIEIKPEEKQEEKETFRSKLNIRVKPRRKISQIISKLTSKFGSPKVIPESAPICMFQRFEKTKTVWVNEAEEVSM